MALAWFTFRKRAAIISLSSTSSSKFASRGRTGFPGSSGSTSRKSKLCHFVWRVWTLHIACSISVKQLASSVAAQAIQSVSAPVPVTRTTARSRSVATVSAPVPVTRTTARSRSVATVSAPVPVTRTTTTVKTEGKIVACFKRYGTSKPSQSEIFYVIVACSLCLCVLANTHEQATITENISLWEAVLVLQGQYTRAERTSSCFKRYGTSTPSQSKILYVIVACSLCSCVLAFQYQHTLPK